MREPDHQSSPTWWLTIAARLKPEMASAVAAARVDALLRASRQAASTTRYGVLERIDCRPVRPPRGQASQQFARLLMGAGGLLVLIGCASVAMLLLIRTEVPAREFATYFGARCLEKSARSRRESPSREE